MARAVRVLLLMTVVVAAAAAAGRAPSQASQSRPPAVLHGGEPSIEALVRRLLTVLNDADAKGLRRLRVDEGEYRGIIMPGNVTPGESLRSYPDDVSHFFWKMLDTKSFYSESRLLSLFGGHHYVVRDLEFDGGVKEYATYTGHKQLRLTLQADDGSEVLMRTGSVAEIDGRFKFISFIRD